jgi:hypothetical protein
MTAPALRRAAAEGACLFIVTPLGWAVRPLLAEALAAEGASPAARVVLHGWPRLETALRRRLPSPSRDACAARFEAAWRRHFPRGHAEAWVLPPESFDAAARVKARLRPALGALPVSLGLPGRATGHLHPFHLADRDQVVEEALRLAAALEQHRG